MGIIFSFRVFNTKTQVQLEIHSRKEESWANILRSSVKGILTDGLQSKARKPKEAVMACRNLQTLKSFFFLSGNQNCLYEKTSVSFG